MFFIDKDTPLKSITQEYLLPADNFVDVEPSVIGLFDQNENVDPVI